MQQTQPAKQLNPLKIKKSTPVMIKLIKTMSAKRFLSGKPNHLTEKAGVNISTENFQN